MELGYFALISAAGDCHFTGYFCQRWGHSKHQPAWQQQREVLPLRSFGNRHVILLPDVWVLCQ